MKKHGIPLVLLLINLIFVHGTASRKNYIVYMGEHTHPSKDAIISANNAMLASALADSGDGGVVIQHYTKSFRGFSAMLTPEQARRIQEREEVVSVFESKMIKLHSTHSWDFLGVELNRGTGGALDLGSDVIIGHIDTGVWPESESFNDAGLGPVPNRFKGECVTGQNFSLANCNRKIIGARYYFQGMEADGSPLESFNYTPIFRSARDEYGHGSHTASTAAGSVTPYSSLLGMAAGHARGGASGARLAVYKACWFGYCSWSDILSAFDDAIADGVDIISLSSGPSSPQTSYFEDSINIGSFHAFRKGILVSASAGNEGGPSTVVNSGPWILTVAASSIDRNLNTYLSLGNSRVLRGTSLNPTKLEGNYGIISGSAAAVPGIPVANASYCQNNTLNHNLVAGKIVVCTVEDSTVDRPEKSVVVKRSGGAGMILVDPAFIQLAMEFVIPSVLIGATDAGELQKYLDSERDPVGNISKTATVIGGSEAPEMTSFSSMGPNLVTPDIIKPDITAPGLNILAAWSPAAPTTLGPLKYNIESGTSMACPHASGAAAIVRSHHPDWSPGAVMSALMTTANVLDSKHGPILRNQSSATPFNYGSGQLNPIAALNPGLVYDFGPRDIINFLCSAGTTPAGFKNLTGEAIRCRKPLFPTHDLNYPSIGVANMRGVSTVHRTVTNVHDGHWVYNAMVEAPEEALVHVVPDKLEFFKAGEKKSFKMDLVPLRPTNGSFVFGSLTWSDGTHRARSPIALKIVSV